MSNKKILGILLAGLVCIGGCNACKSKENIEVKNDNIETIQEVQENDTIEDTENQKIEINTYDTDFKNRYEELLNNNTSYENSNNKELIQQCINEYNLQYNNFSDELKNKYNDEINRLNDEKYSYEQKQQEIAKQTQVEQNKANENNSINTNNVNNKNEIVYITPKGKKYHTNSHCRTIKNGCDGIDINEAINQGYDKCKVCK